MRAWINLSRATPRQIETRLGPVRGLDCGPLQAFLGLPYAAPPIGAQRWRPPAPAAAWRGVFNATHYPNRAPQQDLPAELHPPGGLRGQTSEDCLYLNVFTPAADKAKRPVLVWIHGGGYRLGSGNETDLPNWCEDYDFVVVSINYRLGMLGFLDLSRFGPEYRTSSSLGFQDQIAALAWVRANIADYGGDPDCVTIMGGSAGAGCVLALMAAPSASSLFQRAIAISPLEIFARPPDVLTPLAAQQSIGVDELFAQLLAAKADDIVALQTNNGYHIHGLFALAAADGEVIAAPTAEAIAAGVSRASLIAGATREEGTMISGQIGDDPAFSAFFIDDMAANIAGGDAARYHAFLNAATAGQAPVKRMERAYFDYFRAASLRAAQALAGVGVSAWIYSFEAPNDHPFGATHGADIRFISNGFEAGGEEEVWFYKNSPQNRRIAATWSAALARFAASGDPNGADLPTWTPYSATKRATLVIGAEPQVVDNWDSPDALAAYGLA